jgi:hypothetical protein
VIGVGIAVAGLGTGIGFTLAAHHSESVRDEKRGSLPPGDNVCGAGSPYPQCDQITQSNRDASTFHSVALGGFVLGGAAAVATGLYVVLSPREHPARSSSAIMPWTSARGGGVAYGGSF